MFNAMKSNRLSIFLFPLVFLLSVISVYGASPGGAWVDAGGYSMTLELQRHNNVGGVPFYVDRNTGRVLVDIGTNITITGTVVTATNVSAMIAGQTARLDVNQTNSLPLTQVRTYSTNIVLASATTPVVLGGGTPFRMLTVVGNSLGHTANTNTIYIQTQADDGTNGVPIGAGLTGGITLPPNTFDYLSNYWVGGVVGGAQVFWTY